jgi:hypothetical protein
MLSRPDLCRIRWVITFGKTRSWGAYKALKNLPSRGCPTASASHWRFLNGPTTPSRWTAWLTRCGSASGSRTCDIKDDFNRESFRIELDTSCWLRG